MAEVKAGPTKRFFVSMLTRDIDLKDAIMDLLDNCVDGVLRQIVDKGHDEDQPYKGYWAKITANPDMFSIEDNCGGIPRDIALNTAFRLGRGQDDRDKDIPTVGMYGIGMKRAIFKMGKHSTVTSRNEDQTYYVEISPEWIDDDNSVNWTLDLIDTQDGLEYNGTTILVDNLYSSISRQFDEDETPFLKELTKEIERFFALIIKKGFRVYLNDVEVQPISLDILVADDFREDQIQAYAYRGVVDDVQINIVLGFYSRLATVQEIEDDLQIPRSRENAGWTVICNDRVVLNRDKTAITGWGVRDVPAFHNQFISIAGVVVFSSDKPINLPLNTTKRGLDTSSLVYWHALDFMMEGLKKFTDFTNRWKGRESETNATFQQLKPKDATRIADSIPDVAWKNVRGSIGQRYSPNLPLPPRNDTKRRILLYRNSDEIELLGEFFFDDAKADPTQIGNRCFDDALVNARRNR
ncbi:MAG: ATP-binding protein [Kouleothrix sp.]|nr:ATP-binding protein [Kouleothrix sp.]